MITRRDVFQAIADPTRREIIGLLAVKSHNLHSVVSRFDVTRPAIAKHLKILIECGLVEVREMGREKYFHAKLKNLEEVSAWTDRYKAFWTRKLDALGVFLEADVAQRKVTVKSKKRKK